MSVFRALAFALLPVAMTVAPANAATYAWPFQITQPVTVNNLTWPGGSELIVLCGIAAPTRTGSTATTLIEGTASVPVSLTVTGTAAYSGNIVVPVDGSSSGVGAPVSGNLVTCTLRQKTAGVFSNVGNPSSLRLP